MPDIDLNHLSEESESRWYIFRIQAWSYWSKKKLRLLVITVEGGQGRGGSARVLGNLFISVCDGYSQECAGARTSRWGLLSAFGPATWGFTYSVLFCSDRLEGGSVCGISAISISTSVLENGISSPPPLKLPNLFTVLCLLYPVSLLIWSLPPSGLPTSQGLTCCRVKSLWARPQDIPQWAQYIPQIAQYTLRNQPTYDSDCKLIDRSHLAHK